MKAMLVERDSLCFMRVGKDRVIVLDKYETTESKKPEGEK